MLITCFQCRRQLEAPNDSAGKRVHCPHCRHVVVVPARLKSAEPATALPSMELDDGQEAPGVPSVKHPSAYPFPPMPLPLDPPSQAPTKDEPTLDDLSPLPSIDRGARRTGPRKPAKASNGGWRNAGWAGLFLFVVVFAIVGIISGSRNHRHFPPPKAQPPQFVMPKIDIPKIEIPPPENLKLPQNGGPFGPQFVVFAWRPFQDQDLRFMVQFPAPPVKKKRHFDQMPMTVFEVQNNGWEFAVAHRALSAKDFALSPLAQRFSNLKQSLCIQWNGFVANESLPQLRHVHPGREWTISGQNGDGTLVHVRTFYVRDGELYRHYVLTARGPLFTDRFNVQIDRFFNSFDILLEIAAANSHIGKTVVEEIDDLDRQGRRENEFTALALHPDPNIFALGAATSKLRIELANGDVTQIVKEGKPIEQLVFSPDGKWLASACAAEVRWSKWEEENDAQIFSVAGGLRCAFSNDRELIVATKDSLELHEVDKAEPIDVLPITGLSIQGLALSSDRKTIAVFGDKTIELWNWPEKKLRGRIEAHDASITAVAFSPDGKTLASASVDRAIKLWNVADREKRATLSRHAWTVEALAFSPDGKHLASGGLDGMFLLWDVQPKEPRLVWAQANQYPVRSVAWDAKGDHVYLTCKLSNPLNQAEGGRQLLRKLRKIARTDMQENPALAEKIAAQFAGLHIATMGGTAHFTPDGKTVATTPDASEKIEDQRRVRVWDAATARLKYSLPAASGGELSPDGKWLMFASSQRELHILEMETLRVLPAHFPRGAEGVPTVLFTPDGRCVWIRQTGEFVRYELPNLVFKQRLKLKVPNEPKTVTIFPARDRQTFLVETSPNNGGLRTRTLYSSADGKPLPLPKPAAELSQFLRLRKSGANFVELEDFLRGTSQVVGQQRHTMVVSALHPDGKLAATEDSTQDIGMKINLWDLQERRPILQVPDALARHPNSLTFAVEGRLLAWTANAGWTRVVPMDWLMERKELLPCQGNDVAAP